MNYLARLDAADILQCCIYACTMFMRQPGRVLLANIEKQSWFSSGNTLKGEVWSIWVISVNIIEEYESYKYK